MQPGGKRLSIERVASVRGVSVCPLRRAERNTDFLGLGFFSISELLST